MPPWPSLRPTFLFYLVTSELNVDLRCSRLSGLQTLPQLEELVLDSNAITEDVLDTLPKLPNLNALSLNKNQV